MSEEYNLTIFDLEEGKEYLKKGVDNIYYTNNGLLYFREGSVGIKAVNPVNSYIFKEIKPEPELRELKLLTQIGCEGYMFSTYPDMHKDNYVEIPYQIKDGKIFIESN
jgi:hypothetical protein